ncbi:MAG: DMT family transporter [Eubacteriales bacterium]|nr:DMT family transporter [Eubacteriales bacterium]
MWFWLAITALLMWSGSDLFSKIGSRPDDKYSHWKMVMAVGFVMGLHAMYEIFVGKTPISMEVIIAYLPASALYIASMVLGYVGLRYIELSVSSPICNSSGAIAALLTFFFLGQRLSALQTVAIALVCAGVIALGIVEYMEDDDARLERQKTANIQYSRSLLALLLPVLYCILDAAGTFADVLILETLDESMANVAYELTFLAMAVFAFLYVVVFKHQKLSIPRETPKLVAGIFETAGQFAYVYAIGANAVAAAPIISAYCAASVLWSRLFLKEKLSWKHYVAISVAIVGIVIVGVLDEIG